MYGFIETFLVGQTMDFSMPISNPEEGCILGPYINSQYRTRMEV